MDLDVAYVLSDFEAGATTIDADGVETTTSATGGDSLHLGAGVCSNV